MEPGEAHDGAGAGISNALSSASADLNVPNPRGRNQHGAGSFVQRYPDLPQWVQGYLDNRCKQQDIIENLARDHNVIPKIKLRTLQKLIQEHNLKTSRRPGHTPVEGGAAILHHIEHDQLRRTGVRNIHHALKTQGVHLPRNFVENFLRALEPHKVDARWPTSRTLHRSSLVCSGPNEEWSCDGHEKLVPEMGIAIWGGVDKYSRRVLRHYAVPSARTSERVRALYLRLSKQEGGICFQLSLDKGSETNHAAAIQITLRLEFSDADIDIYPAYRGLTSIYNITVERQWWPLFNEVLENILHWWRQGLHAGTYHPEDEVHQQIARWVWAQVVQAAVDKWVEEKNSRPIRKQRDSRLPTGGSPNDFFYHPEEWGGVNRLVRIPEKLTDELISRYSPDDLFAFATPEIETKCKDLYDRILHNPSLTVATAWPVVHGLINVWDM